MYQEHEKNENAWMDIWRKWLALFFLPPIKHEEYTHTRIIGWIQQKSLSSSNTYSSVLSRYESFKTDTDLFILLFVFRRQCLTACFTWTSCGVITFLFFLIMRLSPSQRIKCWILHGAVDLQRGYQNE
jgi:hypothetical protein